MSELLGRIGPRFAFALATAFLIAHSLRLQPWTMDDAYIYFRYAENFAAGNGVVYNVGERVEGYTTFVWVSLLAAGRWLGFDLVVLSKVYGFAFALGCLGFIASAHRWLSGCDRRTAAVSTVLLGSCGAFTTWAMGGMDTPFIAFFALANVVGHCVAMRDPANSRRAALSGALCGFSIIARPETVLISLLLGLDRLVADRRAKRVAPTLAFGFALLAVYAPYFAWRYAYYGYLLPNTFYAKVGGSVAVLERGARYASKFAFVTFGVVSAGLSTLFLGRAVSSRVARAWIFPMSFVLHAAYVIYVGGDAMPSFRFFAMSLPLLCLSAGLALTSLIRTDRALLLLLAAIVAFQGSQTLLSREMDLRVRGALVGRGGEEAGRWLRKHMRSDTVIAVNAAGAIAYFSGFRTIDMLGLNDTHIAHRVMPSMGKRMPGHEKGDGAYVFSLSPDYIQFGASLGQRKPRFVADQELAVDPRFALLYRPIEFVLPSGRTLLLYQRHGAAPIRSDD